MSIEYLKHLHNSIEEQVHHRLVDEWEYDLRKEIKCLINFFFYYIYPLKINI